jgi:hypothetical protein
MPPGRRQYIKKTNSYTLKLVGQEVQFIQMNITHKDYYAALVVVLWMGLGCMSTYGAGPISEIVTETYHGGDFKLVYDRQAADIYVDENEYKVAKIAASDFVDDVERVTGQRPQLKHSIDKLSQHAVLIGTIGQSTIVDKLVKAGKIDVRDVEGQWETFIQTVVSGPLPGVEKALVIAGSDRRGTAYGVYDLSEKTGVSPWYWWSDVTPVKKESLVIRDGTYKQGPPSVKYRGIFINDEMWGIRPWASKTFAPEEGMGLGPTTYKRIFELLLRLKANYIWPAMHGGTRPFNFYPLNKVAADDYAIVMGSSHIEPMLRNNMGGSEWDSVGCGPWNYFSNRDNIYQYWKDRVRTNGMYENVYTVGMRGQDDQAMEGGDTLSEKIGILEKVFADQRTILREEVNPDITKVPQVFVMYTEVLGFYNEGLKVPDDVIMCWPEDNFGYIRQLPVAKEQTRSGGSGVYYHIQWLTGATPAYPWLNTTPPGLIWEEMSKAYDYNARQLWVLNVGDIKPGEIGMEFFLRLGWDVESRNYNNIRSFLVSFGQRYFGSSYAEQIADIMEKYYQLGYARRPEHLVQYSHNTGLQISWFSTVNYNDEAERRIEEYDRIAQQAETIYQQLPTELKDAFFQLVLYPVKCCSLMNQKIIYADKSAKYAEQGRASAALYAQKARQAAEEIDAMTDRYNRGLVLAGDKWDHFMSLPGPWGAQGYQFEMPPLSDFNGEGPAQMGVSLEGGHENELADFSVYTKNKRFIDLFNKGKGEIEWKVVVSHPWLLLSESSGRFEEEKRIWATIDWNSVPKGQAISGKIRFSAKNDLKDVTIKVFNPAKPAPEEVRGFVESHGYICMEAEHYTSKVDRDGASWEIVQGLGRSGDSVAVYPTTTASRTTVEDIMAESPVLEYDVYVFHPGAMSLTVYCIPTSPITCEHGRRLAVSVDDESPEIVSYRHGDSSVFSNVMYLYCQCKIETPGSHTLKIRMVDPGVVIDRIVMYSDPARDSYLGPPESFCQT